MKIFTALGLMSGTSMDGIDIALLRSDGGTFVDRGPNGFLPYEKQTQQNIEDALIQATSLRHRHQRPGTLASLEDELTQLHQQAIDCFLVSNNMSADEIDLIGFHGQTILHRPEEALTIQLGNGQLLADQSGIEVIYDMRANDMEHGGQGAPLVPVYHGALFNSIASQFSSVGFANIGGISNITFVGSAGELIAFDSGPGNCLIDQWVKQRAGVDFDENGSIARDGEVLEGICSQYLAHPYFCRPIPKSLDRKDFEPLLDPSVKTADGARSLVRLTTLALLESIDQLPEKPDLIVICGGGAQNPMIMEDLVQLAQPVGIRVITADDAKLSASAMEAEAFAYLAIRSKLGKPLTYPKTTGCNLPVTGGVSAIPISGRIDARTA